MAEHSGAELRERGEEVSLVWCKEGALVAISWTTIEKGMVAEFGGRFGEVLCDPVSVNQLVDECKEVCESQRTPTMNLWNT